MCQHFLTQRVNKVACSRQCFNLSLNIAHRYPKAGVSKLSSEMHLSLWTAISCPRSRQLSLVTFKGDYAILALRNYKMQAEKHYSYLTIVKLLTTFRSMKHSRDSLEMQFIVYKAATATLLHSMYFCWNGVPLSCI